ncbi:MAG: hypothetical protein WAM27_03655 [Nitrososphaeraceae archaeon]|jgi:hypothetical protein
MEKTFNHQEEIAELAVSVTNELAKCACSHCIDIYIRGEEEHFSSKAKINEIKTNDVSISERFEKGNNQTRIENSDRGTILSTV